MTNRVPLTLDTSTNTIEELPSGDNLDLSGSNISSVGNIVAGNSITANYFVGNLYGQANTAVSATTAGTVTTAAQPNITSVGSLSSLTVTGQSNLDDIANVKITGGTANQVIKTDGAGNLSFTTIQGDSFMLQPVRVSTDGNITLSGTQTIDGVSVLVGDRVLVRRQSNQTQNGIYVVASGSWTRATDFDTGSNTLRGGITVTPQAGTNLQGVTFVCTNTTAITVGSTNITFERSVNTGFISIWTSASPYDNKASAAASSGAMAIGVGASATTDSVSIGYVASSPSGAGVSIGYAAYSGSSGTSVGVQSKSGSSGVGIGRDAGSSSYPANCVDVGAYAGRGAAVSSTNRVAVGYLAHDITPSANSVAVGAFAGRSSAHANTIVINATGANLNTDGASRAYVKPIRTVSDVTGLSQLYYNTTTGEIVVYVP